MGNGLMITGFAELMSSLKGEEVDLFSFVFSSIYIHIP